MKFYSCSLAFRFKANLKKATFLLFVFITFSDYAFSEPDPVKFGKIDKSLLEMKVYDKDTTADAVIICDYGDFDPNSFNFTRIYRLKVLRKSGCDRANFVMGVRSRSNIRGFTYNLVNGEIAKDKLKSESIFEEMVTHDSYRYRVTMPNVQVGSVIDIQVIFTGIPYVWYFQSTIPVMWSELRLFSGTLGIQKNFFGFQTLSVNEDGRWVGKNMPALKPEPFMNDLDNFLTKFELQVSSYRGFSFASTWDEINHYLLHESALSRELETHFFMGDEAKAIKDTAKSEKSKIIAAYETIQKKIKWNDEENLYPSNDIGYRLKKASGNSADVNIALFLLLRRLDIEAYPIALSTRSNGMLTFFSPTLNKFNYLIVLAKAGGENILLDATDEYLPAGYLPERCLNGSARIIDDKISGWIELKPAGKSKKRLFANVKLNTEGIILGELSYIRDEYEGYNFRKDYAKFNDKSDYIRKIEQTNPGLRILETSFQNLDSFYAPAIENYKIEYNGNTDITDSAITFYPFFVERINANPFKLEERKIPVDFIYPIEKNYLFRFEIPENYKVSEIPAAVSFVLPDNNGKFIYRVAVQGSVVQVICNISITKYNFTQAEYPYVKQLYAEIVQKESEPITIKKK